MILGGYVSLRSAHDDLARFSISNSWFFTWCQCSFLDFSQRAMVLVLATAGAKIARKRDRGRGLGFTLDLFFAKRSLEQKQFAVFSRRHPADESTLTFFVQDGISFKQKAPSGLKAPGQW